MLRIVSCALLAVAGATLLHESDDKLNMLQQHASMPPLVPLEPKLASSSSSSTPLAVTMDWSQDGMYFALSNYRALEAVLTLHSAADVEVDIVAPSYGDWYRHGNLISKRYFDKYKKRGYGVQVHRIDPDSAPRRSKGDGKSWWHVSGPVFKESLRDAISNYNIEVRLPSAAMLWLRLARMQERGGIFLDFTTLLLKPAEGHRGYSIAPPGCIAALTSDARLPPMVLAFNQNDPVLECALKELESTCKLAGKADVQCPVLDVDRLLSSCFSRFSVANSLEHAVAWLCESQSLLDAPVEDPAVGAALQGRLALWLGPRAMDGMWQRAVEGSVSAALQEQAKKGLTRYAHPSQNAADSKCRVRCNHYLPVPLGKSSGKPHEARASAENCAPQVIVPGTRKGASSFIFHLLAQHPQFVHPVDGSGFKETAAYLHMYDKGRRPNFFPHLEEDDNFITGDGHVDLMMTENAPERIQADNPSAQAIFILREPAERAYSDYKYVYNLFRDKGKSFDTSAREAVSNLEKCLGADGAADEAATAKKFWRCHDGENEIVKRGMYVYQVLKWIQVLGKEQVLVLSKEETEAQPAATIKRVVDFLGLCDYEFEPRGKENQRSSNIKPEHKASDEGFKRLAAFFEPYNRALYKLLDKDFGWEARVAAGRPDNASDCECL